MIQSYRERSFAPTKTPVHPFLRFEYVSDILALLKTVTMGQTHATIVFGLGINIFQQCGLYYKTYYDRNLRTLAISWSVCPWQAFSA
jgi:hypothetical protein